MESWISKGFTQKFTVRCCIMVLIVVWIDNSFLFVFCLYSFKILWVVGNHNHSQMETPKSVLKGNTAMEKGLSISVKITTKWKVHHIKPVKMVNGLDRWDASVSYSYIMLYFLRFCICKSILGVPSFFYS